MTTAVPSTSSIPSAAGQYAPLQTTQEHQIPVQDTVMDKRAVHWEWLAYTMLCIVCLYISYHACSNLVPIFRTYIHGRESIIYNGVAYSPVTYFTKKIENPKDEEVVISGPDLMTALPTDIGDLTVKMFLLDGNPISSLPDSIGNIASIKQLGVTNTNLRTIPPSIGGITSLMHLHLQGNRITHLPDTFGPLQNLEAINLAYNRLTTLPPSMKSLANAKVLDLTGNKFTSFPANLPPNLEVLFIGGNPIPLKELDDAAHRYSLSNLVIYY